MSYQFFLYLDKVEKEFLVNFEIDNTNIEKIIDPQSILIPHFSTQNPRIPLIAFLNVTNKKAIEHGTHAFDFATLFAFNTESTTGQFLYKYLWSHNKMGEKKYQKTDQDSICTR